MTFTEPSGPTPGKIAGFALLGVAVVAAVIGIVTLIGDNGDGQADPQPPSSSAPGDSGSSTATSSPDSSGSSTTEAPTTTSATVTTPITPSNTAPTPAPGDGQSTPSGDVRVLNNSMISGLANRAADDLRSAGWNVIEVGNYTPATNADNVATTTVYYRPGTDEKATAETLGAYYGMRVEPRFPAIANRGSGVIVVVTNDYKGGRGK
jgi:hypothetical protein